MKDQKLDTEQVSKANKLILIALWSFLSGVFVATFVFIPPLVAVLIIAVALASFFLERHLFILIALVAFSLGVLRFDIKDFHELQPAGNTGVVVSEPEHRESDTRFVVKTDTGEKVLVSTDLLSEVEYGDRVSLSGKARLVEGDYAKYLSKDDIFYTMSFAKTTLVSKDNGNPIIATLLKIKNTFVEKMKGILPEPESSLLAGLVVSGKQALPASILEEFRRSGVVHIVVLSGYNITIISEFLFSFFRFSGIRMAATLSVLGVSLFTLMAGAPATVLRGAIMVLLIMFGKIFGREGDAPRILLFTATLMVMVNPKILVFDPSFHLSFLAMLGLIYGVPIVEKFMRPFPEKYGLRTLASTTLATQIFVFPYILYNMGNFSTVFLLANMAVLSVIPITMFAGFLATLLGFISPVLAWPFSFVSHILLGWILGTAGLLGGLPFASLDIESFPLWVTLVLYAGLAFSVWRLRDSSQPSASLGS